MSDAEKDSDSLPTRTLTVFYVLDTSVSMEGAPIAALNRAMVETIKALGELAKQQKSDCKLKIAVLSFNSTCRWMQPLGPEEAENFVWEDLQAGGLSNIGEALEELDSKLSRSAFLSDPSGNYLPLMIFMTDGYANDDYKKALNKIRENTWFKLGTKIGFAIGDDPDTGMIAEIVGDPEAVLRTDDLEEFAREIKFRSIGPLTITYHIPMTDFVHELPLPPAPTPVPAPVPDPWPDEAEAKFD
jgi:uncharacterized protein YegL